MEKKRYFALGLTVLLWAALALGLWFGPRKDISEGERRPLAQMPALSGQTLLSGSFMEKFEDFTLDQFPLRDSFRRIKSLFHSYVLGQRDNNGIYLSDGFAVKQEYPLNEESLDHAMDRFGYLYEKYLAPAGSRAFFAVAPDKGCYLAEKAGQLALDYDALFSRLEEGLPWARQIDLRGSLCAEDYYRTDTHWRQEKLPETAGVICEALGVTAPEPEEFRAEAVERPFYGVYYGQAALPMEPETMYFLRSDLLDGCRVYDYEAGKYGPVVDLSRQDSRDLYDIFLSGSRSLLTIENPAGTPGKELLVFRDSFGSSLVPLLVSDYARVTLVDIRYIQIDMLPRFLEFTGQDVLFLYSTLVLNNSETIK